jgi:uncharacterized protein YbjT (DUF2867 family)
MTTVLVTGATGTVGSAVARELRGRGLTVRAFVREPDRAAATLGEDVELAVGDFDEPASMRRALVGVDGVFLACANVPGQVRFETTAIDAAAAAGVSRIVKLSAAGAQVGSPLAFWDWHGRIEQHLARSGVPAVVLRPANYMTNLLASAETIAYTARLFAPAGGARVAMVDPRDVAAVAGAVLVKDGHEGQTYVLTGPAAVSYDEIAAALSAATGRPIAFVDVDDEAARQGMLEAGLPGFITDFLVALFGALRAGAHARPTGAVRAITGREPRSIAEFARDHAGAFGGRAMAATPDV